MNTGTNDTGTFDAEKYKTLSNRFNAIVKRTQATMMMERLWPCTIAPLLTGGVFLTTSWQGLWHGLPPIAKMGGLGVFALVAAASSVPLLLNRKNFSVPRADAIARLDQTLGSADQPAFMLNDRLSQGAGPDAQALWDADRLRLLEEWVDKFTIARKKSTISLLPLAAVAASVVISGIAAGPQRVDRIKEAFNWQVPPTPVIAKAWITPPENFREDAHVLDQGTKDSAHGGQDLQAHKSSKMTIVIYDKNTGVTLNGQTLAPSKSNIAKEGTGAKSTFQYDIDLAEGQNAITINNEIFWTIAVAPDTEPTAIIKGLDENTKNPGTVDVEVEEKDDYGVRESEMIITLPSAPNPDATPLPSSKIPPLQIR